jgi:hypothetical protein
MGKNCMYAAQVPVYGLRLFSFPQQIVLELGDYRRGYISKGMQFFTFNVQDIEFKWHIAQILGRLKYTENEMEMVLKKLTEWILNTNESKIVRVNALQSLYDLSKNDEK